MQRMYDVTSWRFREFLLPWKTNKYYTFAGMRARLRSCVWVPGCVSVYMRLRACSLAYAACNAYAPYCDVMFGPSGSTTCFDIISQRARFSGKKSLNVKCVFWFSLQLLSKTFLILRRIQWDIVINVQRASCKVLVILVRFEWVLIILTDFHKKFKTSNFIKIRPVVVYLFHADGHDGTNGRFSQFCERPKKNLFL